MKDIRWTIADYSNLAIVAHLISTHLNSDRSIDTPRVLARRGLATIQYVGRRVERERERVVRVDSI